MKIPKEITVGVCVNDPSVVDGAQFTVEKYVHALRRIALHGYQAIEYSHVAHLSEGECRKIDAETRRLGMRSWSIHSEHLNGADDAAVREYYRIQTICAANTAALGAKVMVFHPPNAALSAEKKAEVIRRVADICGEHGVRAAIENVNRPVGEFCELVRLANHSNLGYNIDVGHAQLLEGPVEVMTQMGTRIWTTHLQDNFGRTDDHLPPGIGILDWRSILRVLWQSGYDGPLLVELTGGGVKAHRSVEALRGLSLEKEQAMAIAYLRYIHRVLLEGHPFGVDC
ncbi:MAG: sugar phosphate isomerase/epimerase [Verrucomicrobiae bacterium]|nr:sugar phosphate isomerase/epimerase [Verrucomicrobiae bacterium]